MRRITAFVAAASVILAAASPLQAANREHEQILADIRMLQEQTQQLQVLIGTLAESLKTISSRMDEQGAATRKGFADQKLLVDALSSDVRVVREKVDETNVRLTSLTQDVEGLRELMPSLSAPAAPGETPAEGETPGAGAAPPPAGPVGTGVSPRRLFEEAYADYTAGQWTLAISAFETYLKTYPRSELADDAQYYIGESYAGDSKFREAATAYERVISDYPASNMLPEAWYKVGISYERLKQPDRARTAFQYVIKNFAESQAAALARQALVRLDRQNR
jgi:tol-pal system protein YbgF